MHYFILLMKIFTTTVVAGLSKNQIRRIMFGALFKIAFLKTVVVLWKDFNLLKVIFKPVLLLMVLLMILFCMVFRYNAKVVLL